MMKFTIDEIKAEHQKVKLGAYLLKYIQPIKEKEGSHYITYILDGNTEYFDNENNQSKQVLSTKH